MNSKQLVAKVVGLVEAPGIGLDLPLDVRGTAFQQRVGSFARDSCGRNSKLHRYRKPYRLPEISAGRGAGMCREPHSRGSSPAIAPSVKMAGSRAIVGA